MKTRNFLIFLVLQGTLVGVSMLVGTRYHKSAYLLERLDDADGRIFSLEGAARREQDFVTSDMRWLQDAIETLEVRRDLTGGVHQLSYLLDGVMERQNGTVIEFGHPRKDDAFGHTEWPGGDAQVELLLRIKAYRKDHPVAYKTSL
ncbi:MAG: hypothetical protein NTY53_09250, partial [Kiritimatiellaeota bacterium]|nr:hypothetical protein [Kiritimatiellota bacterium]